MSGRVLFLGATLSVCTSICAADTPEDPAVALAQILAAKGTITAEELSSVTAASGSARVGALASLLQRKGLLNESEVRQIWAGSAGDGQSAAAKPILAQ